MTKDQIEKIKFGFPQEYEQVIVDFYEWETAYLIKEIVKWIPQSEFMKLIHQAEKNING